MAESTPVQDVSPEIGDFDKATPRMKKTNKPSRIMMVSAPVQEKISAPSALSYGDHKVETSKKDVMSRQVEEDALNIDDEFNMKRIKGKLSKLTVVMPAPFECIDCLDLSDKVVQTSLTRNASTSVQTSLTRNASASVQTEFIEVFFQEGIKSVKYTSEDFQTNNASIEAKLPKDDGTLEKTKSLEKDLKTKTHIQETEIAGSNHSEQSTSTKEIANFTKGSKETASLKDSPNSEGVMSDLLKNKVSESEVDEVNSNSVGNSDSNAAISSCNSFEFVLGDGVVPGDLQSERNNPLDSVSDVRSSDERKLGNNIQIHARDKHDDGAKKPCKKLRNKDSGSSSSSCAESSRAVTLGELISNKQSDKLTSDIDRSVQLLHRLSKSKKYDDVTKKYYLRKIIKKILNSKYMGESTTPESDHSVEEPCPNKSDKFQIDPQSNNVKEDPSRKLRVDDFESVVPNRINPEVNQQKAVQNFTIQTFTENILPAECTPPNQPGVHDSNFKSQEPKGPKGKKAPKVRGVYTSSNYFLPQSYYEPQSKLIEKPRSDIPKLDLQFSQSNSASSPHTDNSATDKSSATEKSWKDEITDSERLFEEKRGQFGDGSGDHQSLERDCVLNFAKRERETQLNWIKNEIGHLSKLKSLLEQDKEVGMDRRRRKDDVQNVLEKVLKEPHLEDIAGESFILLSLQIDIENVRTR